MALEKQKVSNPRRSSPVPRNRKREGCFTQGLMLVLSRPSASFPGNPQLRGKSQKTNTVRVASPGAFSTALCLPVLCKPQAGLQTGTGIAASQGSLLYCHLRMIKQRMTSEPQLQLPIQLPRGQNSNLKNNHWRFLYKLDAGPGTFLCIFIVFSNP